MYNRIVAAPGVNLNLGTEGGNLLLVPPAEAAGQLNFFAQQCRVWSLLREQGPDQGYPIPQLPNSDFPQPMVQRDLNISLGMFVSETGLAPKVSERFVTVPVIATLDQPVPPDCAAITRVEYNPAGQQTYTLEGKSFEEFDAYWNDDTLSTGQPYVYRQMYAGYIRVFPQPGPGQALGNGIGSIVLTGTPTVGQTVSITLTNPPAVGVVIPTYTVVANDTASSVATKLSNSINASNAVVGATPFLSPSSANGGTIQLTSLTKPGTQITYIVTVTGAGLGATPVGLAYLTPSGDTMTYYYTSLGTVMVNPGDTPGIPPQFHMAPVYRVLADYWNIKQDFAQADRYEKKYGVLVKKAKDLEWDAERSVQPTTAGYYETDLTDASGVF